MREFFQELSIHIIFRPYIWIVKFITLAALLLYESNCTVCIGISVSHQVIYIHKTYVYLSGYHLSGYQYALPVKVKCIQKE